MHIRMRNLMEGLCFWTKWVVAKKTDGALEEDRVLAVVAIVGSRQEVVSK